MTPLRIQLQLVSPCELRNWMVMTSFISLDFTYSRWQESFSNAKVKGRIYSSTNPVDCDLHITFCPPKRCFWMIYSSKCLLNKISVKLVLWSSETIRPLLYTKTIFLWHLHFLRLKWNVKKKACSSVFSIMSFILFWSFWQLVILPELTFQRTFQLFSLLDAVIWPSIHSAETWPSILRSCRDLFHKS